METKAIIKEEGIIKADIIKGVDGIKEGAIIKGVVATIKGVATIKEDGIREEDGTKGAGMVIKEVGIRVAMEVATTMEGTTEDTIMEEASMVEMAT